MNFFNISMIRVFVILLPYQSGSLLSVCLPNFVMSFCYATARFVIKVTGVTLNLHYANEWFYTAIKFAAAHTHFDQPLTLTADRITKTLF